MKKLVVNAIVWCLICAPFVGMAQINLPFTSNVKPAVEQVLTAYTNDYAQIKGEQISKTEDLEVYRSAVTPAGALSSSLVVHRYPHQTNYSWEALMLSEATYEAAAKKYHTLCQQLNGIAFRKDVHHFRLRGDYNEPSPSKSFASTVFEPETDDEKLSKLRLEVVMDTDMLSWTLRILVYDREWKDNQRMGK